MTSQPSSQPSSLSQISSSVKDLFGSGQVSDPVHVEVLELALRDRAVFEDLGPPPAALEAARYLFVHGKEYSAARAVIPHKQR